MMEIPTGDPLFKLVGPIMPIGQSGEVRPHGTAFLIAPGYAISAKHVFADYLKAYDRCEPKSGANGTVSFVTHIILRPGTLIVDRWWYSSTSDLVLIKVRKPNNVTWDDFGNIPPLELKAPELGERIAAYGCPETSHSLDDNINQIEINIQPRKSSGIVQHVYPLRRDRGTLNFPCYQMNAQIEGGMSGGPIVAQSGRIIGVICYSCNQPGEEPLSYAVTLWPLTMMTLPTGGNSPGQGPKVIDLFASGRLCAFDWLNFKQLADFSRRKLLPHL